MKSGSRNTAIFKRGTLEKWVHVKPKEKFIN